MVKRLQIQKMLQPSLKSVILQDCLSGDLSLFHKAQKILEQSNEKTKQELRIEYLSIITDTRNDLRIREAAGNALGLVGDTRIDVLNPQIITVPTGAFLMGSSEDEAFAAAGAYCLPREWFMKEIPQRRIELEEFEVMKFMVTNLEYRIFLEETRSPAPSHWDNRKYPYGQSNHPVWGVQWDTAVEYSKWLSYKTGREFRLPSELEWEKAARGIDGRQYPWGSKFDPHKCNTKESGIGHTTPVGIYPNGTSPYGCLDMAGNIEEWTADWYRPYPGSAYHIDDAGQEYRVTRGGAWNKRGDTARCARRHGPLFNDVRVGIRLVSSKK